MIRPPALPVVHRGWRTAAWLASAPDWLFMAGCAALYVVLFWPVLAGGRLLAPGDGLDLYLPPFFEGAPLWSPLLGTGYPVAAGPQSMAWYPVVWIFARAFQSWNGFVVFPYAAATFFMYLYARWLLGNRFAAAIAGISYGMSGYMVARTGHVAFLNAACWMPALLLICDRALFERSWRWNAAGALCFAMIFLSGNPQLGLYAAACALFRMVWVALERKIPLRASVALAAGWCAMSLGLIAVQLLPSIEFKAASIREKITFDIFAQYSAHPAELVTAVFPFALGSYQNAVYTNSYIGWSWIEGSFSIGFFVLFLAIAALYFRGRSLLFWVFTFVVAVLLATDGYTVVGKLLFHLPGYNLYRSHGRALVFADFAAALLAGYGALSIIESATARDARRVAAWCAAATGAACLALLALAPGFAERARKLGVAKYDLSLAANEVRIPLLIAGAGILVCYLWMLRPKARLMQSIAAAMLIASLGSTALYQEWRFRAPSKHELAPPLEIENFAREARARQDSMIAMAPDPPLYGDSPVQLSRMWHWPTLSFYDPVALKRNTEVLPTAPRGNFVGDGPFVNGPALDMFGALFAFLDDRVQAAGNVTYRGMSLPLEPLNLVLGNPAGGRVPPRSAGFPAPDNTRRILVVSSLGNSVAVSQNEPVADLVLITRSGRRITRQLLAGVDTAEYAHDCADVRPFIRHGLAPVYSTQHILRAGQDCALHNYIATIDVDAAEPLDRIELNYVNSAAQMVVTNMWFIDFGGNPSAPGLESFIAGDPSHWRLRGRTAHQKIYENLRVMDRAWVVSQLRLLPAQEIPPVIHTGHFADGAAFDARATALVEELPPGWKGVTAGEVAAGISVTGDSGTRLALRVNAPAGGFLVLRDLYYPGWHAYVNEAEVPIIRANYIQRGIIIPGGQSAVLFAYKPRPFRLGAVLSTLTIALTALLCLYRRRK